MKTTSKKEDDLKNEDNLKKKKKKPKLFLDQKVSYLAKKTIFF